MTAKLNLPLCTRFCLHVSRDDRSVWYIQHDSTHQDCSPKPRPSNGPSNFPISQSLEGSIVILRDFSHFLLHSICTMLGILGSSILAKLSHTEDSSKTLPKEKKCLCRTSNTETLLSHCVVFWSPEASLVERTQVHNRHMHSFWSHQIPVIWDAMLEGAWTPCLWIYSSNYGKQHAQLYLAKNATCILIASCYIFIYLNLSIQTAFADAMIHSSSSRFSFLLFTLILSLIFVLHSWGLETWRIF